MTCTHFKTFFFVFSVLCLASLPGYRAVTAADRENRGGVTTPAENKSAPGAVSDGASPKVKPDKKLNLSTGGTPRIGNEKGDPTVDEPVDYRMSNYREPVPASLKGARVISTAEAEVLYDTKTAVFIDVYPRPPKPKNLPKGTIWRQPKHNSIKGAVWLPNVGYGILSKEFEAYFRSNLRALTGGANKDKALVFFCLRDCWMSWNAAKRAVSWGYSNVIWYPEGVDGWREFNNEIENVLPVS